MSGIRFGVDKRWIQKNRPYLIFPIDARMAQHIGLVIVHWSQLELIFDEYLEFMVEDAWSQEQDGKISSQFKRRRQLFLALSRRIFGAHPTIVAYFETLGAEIREMRELRDMISHGLWLSHHPKDSEEPITYSSTGKMGRRIVTLEISEDLLSETWHKMAGLAGSLSNCSNTKDSRHELSSHDRSTLQVFVSKVRRTLPKRRRLLDQPSTSGR